MWLEFKLFLIKINCFLINLNEWNQIFETKRREREREKCILENQPSESFRIFAFKIDKKAKFLFTIIIIIWF